MRTNWAWMAGLFEGEGCIAARLDEDRLELSLEMADEAVVRTVAAMWRRPVYSRTRIQRATFRTRINHQREVVTFLRRMLPHMRGVKHQQAALAIEYYRTRTRYGMRDPRARMLLLAVRDMAMTPRRSNDQT